MNTKQQQVRQGDVLLIPCEMPEKKGKKVAPNNGRVILAYGEVTGHHHSLDAQVATLFGGEKPVLVVKEITTLDHQEHAPIEITPGAYWVVRQREYTPHAIVRVQD